MPETGHVQAHGDAGDTTWQALWDGGIYTHTEQLAQALQGPLWTEKVRFEAWLAFTLGPDLFTPILDPTLHQDVLARGPIDPGTGRPDGAPYAGVTAPREGPQGLEGYLLHPPTGHVLRAYTEGLPHAGYDLPVLVPMTGPPPNTSNPTQDMEAQVG